MIDDATFGNAKALYKTFGCKLNFAETSTVARQFAERGIRRVSTGETPDIIVVNTCSVTDVADKKCRQSIRSLARRYPDAKILVTGCYAQLKSEEVASLPGVVVVAGIDQKQNLAKFLDEWAASHEMVSVVNKWRDIRDFTPSCARGDRTRYFLKIQDGCDYFCSYCTIPLARGRSRSGKIADIVKQAEQVAAEGGKEIVITGVNIGDFGKGTDETFFDLIRRLDDVDGIERYRISSIEPNLLSDEIIEWVAQSKRFMPYFHIPLQSGDDDVLRLMRRHYDTSLFRHRIEKVREVMPDAFIGVDLIVGARGETVERFDNSCRFIDSLDISRLHVFTYSERPGTQALNIPHVVSQADKHRRTSKVLAISERKLADFSRRLLGTVRPVLVEHSRRATVSSGFTDNYLKVEITASPALDNHIVNVRLKSLAPDGEKVIGELAS
ncbi:MAG: tRNA (N(6)-L-threonylcarbamoyladenosine(37)-C(2))-methylthiotransferase MtaB [Muribaculaceae bacterium]|nr:tRNA (N(6)-L-threonylcarbamoyladenosine(37)-C(2))-methylthiotransferase MtaB [Muribaculaceae bacterium]